jgi:hypothetical protein
MMLGIQGLEEKTEQSGQKVRVLWLWVCLSRVCCPAICVLGTVGYPLSSVAACSYSRALTQNTARPSGLINTRELPCSSAVVVRFSDVQAPGKSAAGPADLSRSTEAGREDSSYRNLPEARVALQALHALMTAGGLQQ